MCVYCDDCDEYKASEDCPVINQLVTEKPSCFIEKLLIANKAPVAEVPYSDGLAALTPHEHNSIRQALSLMNSMILSGEQHTPTSKEKFNVAMEILWGSGKS